MRIFLIILTFLLPTFAMADTELHAIGVYEGNIRTNGRIHGSEVRVSVDRTENPVILSLGSYEPVRWYIETTQDTRVEDILVHGYRPNKSEVFLNGDPVTPRVIEGARFVYNQEGVSFRQLVEILGVETGINVLSSFHGSYSATSEPFVVDKIVADKRLRVDHLKDQVQPQAVPDALKPFMDIARQMDAPALSFTYDGFTLTDNGATIQIAPTLDVPDISHPTGAAYDKDGGRMFGVTFGGEGFIYQYDLARQQWSILTSMDNFDAAAMFYDRDTDRLILGAGFGGSGIMIYDLKKGEFTRTRFQVTDLTGYADLYDPGNGPSAELTPVAMSGHLLLMRATTNQQFPDNPLKSRTYLIDLNNGNATLVAYDNGEANAVKE